MKSNLFLVFITLVATLGGLLFGYDTAVISGAVSSLSNFFGIEGFALGATVSSALIGCIIGSAVSGVLASKFGRKRTLIVAAVCFFLSACGSAYPEFLFFTPGSSDASLLIVFNLYRILGGIGVGLASAICPMYIAEMAPAEIRGQLVSWNQFAIIFGMLVVYFVNYAIVNGEQQEWIYATGWRYMFLSEAVPAGLFGILMFFVPETPRYLTMKGLDDKAMSVLTKIDGAQRAKAILSEIKANLSVAADKISAYGWTVVVVGVLLSFFQQAIGINVVLYYAPTIFEGLGFGKDAAMAQTVIMGFINIAFTVVAILTVDKWGRKPLLIIGSMTMMVGMFAIGILSYYGIVGISTLVFMVIYTAAFMMSWGPICWVLISEIFPNTIRSKAVAIAVAAQWISNFIVSSTFPVLEKFSLPFTYGLYGVMCLLSLLFVWKMVPETKGKTLEQMEGVFKGKA